MEARAAAIHAGTEPETVWLLEHPPLYTAGTSAHAEDLVDPSRFPVFQTGRGGQYTYHGPGQRVAYVMLDVRRRGADVRRFVRDLEEWLILTLAQFDVTGERREGRVGIWVKSGLPSAGQRVPAGPAQAPRGLIASSEMEPAPGAVPGGEDKIAAIGIRLRHWVSFHGVSLNVDPDLEHFTGIVPCGIREYGVTSLAKLGVKASMGEVDGALRQCFGEVFDL
jgi:lipoyl(octanoyl) transferase